jgi:transposase-like protein
MQDFNSQLTILGPDQDDMGRPSLYSEDRALAICERHASGDSIKDICESEGMPPRPTLYRWLREHPEFAALLECARDELADKISKEIVTIADETTEVEKVPISRLRIDARKTRMQLLLLKSFVRRSEHAEALAPRTVTITLDADDVGA